jgi:hypothetical protein
MRIRAQLRTSTWLAASAAALSTLLLLGCPDGGDGGNDIDSDGISDGVDNCPAVPNTRQLDTDGDGVGDACDNCPYVANADQADIDADGAGNACDPGDSDGDGIGDAADNCDFTANPGQEDRDMDGAGDACDGDLDGDGVANGVDPDRDGDGVANAADAFPDDGFRCRDADADTCDDCSSGTDNTDMDGVDSNGDGICDAGVRTAVLTVGVTASTRVFAVQSTFSFPMNLSVVDVDGAGPFDPTSYVVDPPSILVSSNTSVAGQVTAAATFGETTPDPSFLPPADVLTVEFEFTGTAPSLGSFVGMECEVVDSSSSVILGATCPFTGLVIDP